MKRTSPIVLAAAGTAEAALKGTKTVTRRLVKPGQPCRWKAGRPAHVYRQSPRSGARPFGLVQVTSVSQERLGEVTDEEVAREGFPGRGRDWFIEFFSDLHRGTVSEESLVWRVEFAWLRSEPGREG